MKRKGGVKQGQRPGAAMVKFEPPKPEVLTKEGLHRRVDELLGVSEMVKSDSYSPVILPKWEYDGLVNDSENLRDENKRLHGLLSDLRKEQNERSMRSLNELQERLVHARNPAKKTAPKKSPALCLVTDEFRKWKSEQHDGGHDHAHE